MRTGKTLKITSHLSYCLQPVHACLRQQEQNVVQTFVGSYFRKITRYKMYRESTETEPQEAIDPALAGVEFNQAPGAAVHFCRLMRDFFSYSVASCLIWVCLQLRNVSRL